MCTLSISSRPLTSGRSTVIWRSNLPGLNSAGSNISGLFVAAISIVVLVSSNPSSSTRSWFRVCSRSSCPPPSPAPLCRPTASISSMKMIHGWYFFACSNMSRTLAAPTPTNISTKSEPLELKNGTSASPAAARAKRVLPVPGGPTSKTPFGTLAPSFLNFSGSFRKCITSCNSSFDSSQPATSANVTFGLLSRNNFALLRPNAIIRPPPPPCMLLRKYTHTPISRRVGKSEVINDISHVFFCGASNVTVTPFAAALSAMSETSSPYVRNLCPLWSSPCNVAELDSPGTVLLRIWRMRMLPASNSLRNWL